MDRTEMPILMVNSETLFVCLPAAGLVHVGDELREVNGVSVIHKRPDEISQLLVRLSVLSEL